MSYFAEIEDPHSVITPIQGGKTFPETLEEKLTKYEPDIHNFSNIVMESESTYKVLETIRDTNETIGKDTRMSYLKIFRRCVSPVCDTEATKKIVKIPTSVFIENFGHTFKPIEELKEQFGNITSEQIAALSVLLGEYDDRGAQGYVLTDLFFTWFENTFKGLTIDGPRGAGPDVQLRSIFNSYQGDFPCDFVIRDKTSSTVLAIGFARYDSTRGGAQSDDRTGGNSDKVYKAERFIAETGHKFKIIFLADGPGLTHKDTWVEACRLDGQLNDYVRVTTLKTAPARVTLEWLQSD